ncbi:MAG: nucleotidyltransferase domain-containing protein [Nanoarchaeota archaeon]|nr:nucleotidyltransferase domain-containing protein [Nanoarchaeota archaeon]
MKINTSKTKWDLKKFLRLLVKDNPSVWEWLSSDIKYTNNNFFTELKNIYKKSFSKYKLKKHYLSMAKQNFEKYINKNLDVNLKKYIYVLRSIACMNFIKEMKSPPPKNYNEVIEYLPENIQIFFEKIIKDKINSESKEGKRDREVDNYITSFWNKDFKKDKDNFNVQNLNGIFKKIQQI